MAIVSRAVRAVAKSLVCAVLITGCGVDVGANDDLFYLRLVNNTSSAVIVGFCNNAECQPGRDAETINQGDALSIGQDPDGVSRPMAVLSSSRAVLGCLPFQFSKAAPHGTVVTISQMVPCGLDAGARVAAGRDWPFPAY
jgi:hypothetical protein